MVKALGPERRLRAARDRDRRRRAADGAALSGRAAEAAAGRGSTISLTHSRDNAAAVAVAESCPAARAGWLRRWSLGCSRLFDAEGMRAVDRWAIEEQGFPSLELMEAAGRRWPRRWPGWRRRGRCGSSAARATTAATGWSPRGGCAGWASRSRRARALVGDERCPSDLDAWLRRLRRGRRRDLRHRVRGGAARAGRGGDRGDQPLRRAGRRLRHRLRGRRLQRRDRRGGGRGRPHRQLPRRQARAAGRARASGTPASCGWCRSGSRRARRRSRPRGTIDAGRARPGAAPRRRARPSSAPAR